MPLGSSHGFSGTDPKVRCPCGRVLAIMTPEGLELKCARCNQKLVVPFAEFRGGHDVHIRVHPEGRCQG